MGISEKPRPNNQPPDRPNLLKQFVPEGTMPHEGNAPKRELPLDISPYIDEFPAVRDWFLSRQVSNESIQVVAASLKQDAENYKSLQDKLRDLTGGHFPDADTEEEYTYKGLVRLLCEDIETDLQENDGRMFKALVIGAQDMALAQIFGNEDIRDWLFQHDPDHPEHITTFDVEDAAVRATVLYMAHIYIEKEFFKLPPSHSQN